MTATVTTPEECLNYVERVGICTWRKIPKLTWMPSLEEMTAWTGMDLTMQTWFWKDDLHIAHQLYFGMLIAPDTPVFVSLEFLPILIAAQGDIDARTLHEKGLLSSNALRVYEHVERHGPTASQALPWPSGSRMLYLATLQQKFLLAKSDLTGRTRGTYGYKWDLAENVFPESFTQASRLSVTAARDQILSHLNKSNADVTMERATKLFRWQPL